MSASRFKDRWETEQEETELEALRKHEEQECEGVPFCPYCLDDEEQMSKDVDELAEHINAELDKELEQDPEAMKLLRKVADETGKK